MSACLPAHPVAASVARGLVRRGCPDRLPGEVVDDLLLLVSEVVANAVEHGACAGDGGGPVLRLGLVRDADACAVRSTVTDNAAGPLPDPGAGGVPELGAESGRGLFLLDMLADRWGVAAGRDDAAGKTVWFDLRVPHRALTEAVVAAS